MTDVEIWILCLLTRWLRTLASLSALSFSRDWKTVATVVFLFDVQWRTEGGFGGFNTLPPPKFRSFDKAEPNTQFRGKYIYNNLIRIRVSPICKLGGTPD
jgi:hypothetical protein